MRCPKVVVKAVCDIFEHAHRLGKLGGRIEKPFNYFAPAKEADSAKYPKITLVETSVQRQNANYMGRYIGHAISDIPKDEIIESIDDRYPTVLVIVAKPYRDQIISYLENEGYKVESKRDQNGMLNRENGLKILKVDPESNLGWRIVLESERTSFPQKIIAQTADNVRRLNDIVTDQYRNTVLSEANAFEPVTKEKLNTKEASTESPTIKVTSFEGAKGLSAQHVFIAGLHNGEIPRNPDRIQDIEICKFVVGLTRTRKKCTLVYTRSFAGQWKSRSSFISWINPDRYESIVVNSAYWRR